MLLSFEVEMCLSTLQVTFDVAFSDRPSSTFPLIVHLSKEFIFWPNCSPPTVLVLCCTLRSTYSPTNLPFPCSYSTPAPITPMVRPSASASSTPQTGMRRTMCRFCFFDLPYVNASQCMRCNRLQARKSAMLCTYH